MANPFKGEVLIEDGDKNYKFVLGMYAQTVLEEFAGQSWAAFWARAKEWTATDIVNLFRAGFARHHEAMGKRDIADLMDRLGPQKCSEIINDAVMKAMPEEKLKVDGQGDTKRARPPKAPAPPPS